jgi:hypothetical protein
MAAAEAGVQVVRKELRALRRCVLRFSAALRMGRM